MPLAEVLERSLGYGLELTGSEFGFVGLLNDSTEMEVAAIKGFEPPDPTFYQRFRRIPIRPSLFSSVVKEGRPAISNDVLRDPHRVGQPPGHPVVRTYLGVPLKVGEEVIGMIGVANKAAGYTTVDELLLSTFASHAAAAIENARLYETQREMITRLEQLHRDLDQAERERVQHEERARIARDLHDRIQQAIFTMGLALSTILEKNDLPPGTGDRVRDVRRLAAQTADEVKAVIFALSTSRSGSGGIEDSLRRLLTDAGRRHSLDTDLVITGPAVRLDVRLEELLCGVTQEALVNIARHANARMVLVGLHTTSDSLDLVIQDDGDGAPELLLQHFAEGATHVGLKSMKQQVEAVGGTFSAVNSDERGFTVRVRVPV